jgi:hypothetical protein
MSLWDALALAADQIEQYAAQYPYAKKRTIIIFRRKGYQIDNKYNCALVKMHASSI